MNALLDELGPSAGAERISDLIAVGVLIWTGQEVPDVARDVAAPLLNSTTVDAERISGAPLPMSVVTRGLRRHLRRVVAIADGDMQGEN